MQKETINIEKKVDLKLETSLLKAMSVKLNYDMYHSFIDYKRVMPITALLLQDYKKYFNRHVDRTCINFNEFYTYFSNEWHQNNLATHELQEYRDHVIPAIEKEDLADAEVSLIGLLQKQVIEEINTNATKSFDTTKLREVLDNYDQKAATILKESDPECFDISNINFSEIDRTRGVPYFLPRLRDSLGAMVKGEFIVVGAGSGVGKSAFAISQVAYTLKHMQKNNINRPIVYFNSEGTPSDVLARVWSNIYQKQMPGGFEDILENHEKIKESYKKTFTHPSLLIFQISGKSLHFIKQKMEQYKPYLVVLDISDTLAKEADTGTLKKLYDNLRTLSGDYCPILGTTQATGTDWFDKNTGEEVCKKWISDSDFYGSKVGKSGAAAVAIGIGRENKEDRLRYISVPKKKRGDAVRVICEIEEKFSNYREMNW